MRSEALKSPLEEEIVRALEGCGEDHRPPTCPHCKGRMDKWRVPQTPFTEWDNEYMFICFNDDCPYLQRGWETMAAQGNRGFSYRQMYDPERCKFIPVPIFSLQAMRDGIVSES